MAIPLRSQFDYVISVIRDGSGGWRGRAETGDDRRPHPGLAGERPTFRLANGVVTLRQKQDTPTFLNRWFGQSTEETSPRASFRVGTAAESVLEDGDRLRIRRGGTTDIGLTVFRGERFILGVGAIVGMASGPDIALKEDPRAAETMLQGLAAIIDRPDTTLVWLDRSSTEFDSAVEALKRGPKGHRVVVAFKGVDYQTRRNLSELRFRPETSSCYYEDVDARFANRDEWLAYLRGLPTSRPTDLYVRFTLDGVASTVREGHHASADSWHMCVAKVFTPGIPGEWSQLGIARQHPALTAEILVDSTNAIASAAGTDITQGIAQ